MSGQPPPSRAALLCLERRTEGIGAVQSAVHNYSHKLIFA